MLPLFYLCSMLPPALGSTFFSCFCSEKRAEMAPEMSQSTALPEDNRVPDAEIPSLFLSLSLTRMSLQQRSVVWDWAQGMPNRSPRHGLGVSLRVRTGRRAWVSATFFDGSDRSRLWSMRAEVPMTRPSDVSFSLERSWQVRTTLDPIR